jgi:hypothetical protein
MGCYVLVLTNQLAMRRPERFGRLTITLAEGSNCQLSIVNYQLSCEFLLLVFVLSFVKNYFNRFLILFLCKNKVNCRFKRQQIK